MEGKYCANENSDTMNGPETYFATSSSILEDKDDDVLLPKPSSSHNTSSANPQQFMDRLHNNVYEFEKQTSSYSSMHGFEINSSKSLTTTTDTTNDDPIEENSSMDIRIPKIRKNPKITNESSISGFNGKNYVIHQKDESFEQMPNDINGGGTPVHNQIESSSTNNSNSNEYQTSQTSNNDNSTGEKSVIDYNQKIITCSKGTENSQNFWCEQTGESQNDMFLRLKKMSLDSSNLINIRDDVEDHNVEKKKNNFASINSLCDHCNIFDTNENQPSSSFEEKTENTESLKLEEFLLSQEINRPSNNTQTGQEAMSSSSSMKNQPVSYKPCKIPQSAKDSGILDCNGSTLKIAPCSPSTTGKYSEITTRIEIDPEGGCSRTAAPHNSEQIFDTHTDRYTSVNSSNVINRDDSSNISNCNPSPENVNFPKTIGEVKRCILNDHKFSKFGSKSKSNFDDCDETNSSSDLEEACTCENNLACKSRSISNTSLNDSVEQLNCEKNKEKFQSIDSSSKTRSDLQKSLNISFGIRKRKYTETHNIYNEDHETQINAINNDTKSRKRVAFDLSTQTDLKKSQGKDSSTFACRRTTRSLIPTRENPPPELGGWLTQFQRWSNAERLLAIDCLIDHCNPTQVRHMMKIIEPQFQRDFISLLPRELALSVLAYLDPKDLLRAAQTCRSWRFLCDDNLLWKEKCRKAKILGEPRFDNSARGRATSMTTSISSPWKAVYMRQHVIEMNWRSRAIRDPKILKGHDDHVITCLQFSGNRIVSGSDDNTLKVWSAVTGRCLRTLIGHTGGVWSSQMSGNIIISGSTDRTLKVWDMETGQCIHTLMGHTSTVRCMHLHGNKVVSGSRDATLRVWDIHQGNCLHVLIGHLAAVRCVQYDGKLIVSGAYDYMVKIWHPERQECLHTLQGHTNRVYSLQFDGIHVVSGSLDTSIRVWDVETGSCKHTLMGHQSLTSGMELRQNILVSGNADSTVKVWDITTGQCLQTLSGPHKHQSAVTCLQFNSRFVVTSSDDGTVKLWDVKTGEFIRNLVNLDSGGSGGVVWRIRANDTKLICAVGSRNGTEETKLMVLDFDVEGGCLKCT